MEVRLELLFNVTAAYNYDEVIEMLLKLPTGDGVWIFKFSVGNHEALSGASQREVCNRSITDY